MTLKGWFSQDKESDALPACCKPEPFDTLMLTHIKVHLTSPVHVSILSDKVGPTLAVNWADPSRRSTCLRLSHRSEPKSANCSVAPVSCLKTTSNSQSTRQCSVTLSCKRSEVAKRPQNSTAS